MRFTLTRMVKIFELTFPKEVATIVKPETILGWHRKLVAEKFDGSQQRPAKGVRVKAPFSVVNALRGS